MDDERRLASPSQSAASSPKSGSMIKNRLFNKRQRSPSSSPCTSPMISRRTPSIASTNDSNSACVQDEDEFNSRCFCAFPICMNFLDDAAKAIRRTIDRDEQRCLGNETAKLSLNNAISKERLPPDIAQLLKNGSEDCIEINGESIDEKIDRKAFAKSPVLQKSIFRSSRFSNVPPTIRFVLPDEKGKVEKPKRNIRRMLKWCYNNLVPKVIRKVLYASHFQIVSEDTYWIGYWGRHLRTQDFRSVLPYQKINHFPGTFHLGRKDRLWTNIRRMMIKWPNGDFAAVMPRTFILPKDARTLKSLMKATGQMVPIILKPPASARGNGIRVVHRWAQIPRKESMIAQVYVDRPYLIEGNKFDLRLYVFVTCFNPLRLYLYEDGLVRFASVKYSDNLATLGNRLMHLTNYSLNKHAHVDDQNNSNGPAQKWSVKQLWQFLTERGHNVERLMEEIVDLILKAFVSCEGNVNTFIRRHLAYPFACHELFGIDIVLDEDLNPWLLEMNISPSLHTSTELDAKVKSGLAKDTLNLAGVQLPDRQQVQDASPRLPLPLQQPSTLNSLDLRAKQNDNSLTDEERTKQAYHLRKFSENNKIDSSILDNLTPSDVRVLIETEDEYDRRGQFARIFPSPSSTRYLKYFDKPKYYNLLLEEWINKYSHNRETGCAVLESLCKDGYHLAKKCPRKE